MQPINLKELDLKSLKALVYDFWVEKENTEKNIQMVNNEIALRINEAQQKVEENHTQELVTN